MDDTTYCKVNIFYKRPDQKPVWKFISKEQFMKEEKLSEEDFLALYINSQVFYVEIIGYVKE